MRLGREYVCLRLDGAVAPGGRSLFAVWNQAVGSYVHRWMAMVNNTAELGLTNSKTAPSKATRRYPS
jgi:hypothetical protein